ncbi:MAG: hypothetical protein ABIW38_10125 [Ferruginibacter sp.]
MQIVKVQLKNETALDALYTLEERHLIKSVSEDFKQSPSLPGNPLLLKSFKNWIADAEATATVSLKEAKQKWASKRKQLVKLTR